jgi:hypothetical protein
MYASKREAFLAHGLLLSGHPTRRHVFVAINAAEVCNDYMED